MACFRYVTVNDLHKGNNNNNNKTNNNNNDDDNDDDEDDDDDDDDDDDKSNDDIHGNSNNKFVIFICNRSKISKVFSRLHQFKIAELDLHG